MRDFAFSEATAKRKKRMKIDPYYQRQKCRPVTSFWKYKAYEDIRGGSPGRQMAVGLSTTVIFGDLGGYFFGNVRDKSAILDDHMLPLVGQ